MMDTGELNCPGRIRTSTAALQFDTGVKRARGRKTLIKNHLVLQVGLDAAGQAPAHRRKKLLNILYT